MMTKLKALLLLSLFATYFANGQNLNDNITNGKENGPKYSTVFGTIIDSITGKPLEFGSVMLINTANKAELFLNSDSLGRFKFKEVQPGNYNLLAFYAGYPKTEKPVNISGTESLNMLDLGQIKMKSDLSTLKEVKVVSYRELVEQRPDGIVYNADKDGTNQGTTADELLRKVPMLTVDLDGNVQMRGSANVKVLIDGKPSTIIAASIKDALKQIPSDNIKSVEVITSPGAKYDAEGTAGVINIITKKNLIKGINGMVYTGLKYNFKQEDMNGHAGFNLNYRNNNFGLSGYLGGGSWTDLSESQTTRTDFQEPAQESILKQTNTNKGSGQYYWGGISADYQIDTLNSVQGGFNINPGNWKSQNKQTTIIPKDNIDYTRNTEMQIPTTGFSLNAAYNKKFKSNPKQTLDILALYSMNDDDNKYELSQLANQGNIITYRENNKNIAKNKEFTTQVDYALPLKKHSQKLETGLKYINRNVSSDYQLFSSLNGNEADLILDPNHTNELNYLQQVAAAYGQFSTGLTKNLNAIIGLRYEYTDIQGSLRDNGEDFKNHSGNFLPSAILSWDLKNFNKLKISYNQRIERPSIDFINPYENSSDPYNISNGNPLLKPELIHNIELGYSTLLGKSSINMAAFWRRTNNAIESTTKLEDSVSRTTFGNIAQNTTWGANVFGSTRLFDRWMINLSGNVYYKDLYSPSLNLKNNGFEYDANVYTSFNIVEGFSIEGFGMYRGNRVILQGSSSGFYYYRLGLKKSLLKGKADLTLGAENFLTPSVKVTTNYTYQNANYQSENLWYGRGLRLAFSYRFGKMSFSGPKKTIQNDDLKNSQDQQLGNGQQMGG